jgi:hypothetical protein
MIQRLGFLGVRTDSAGAFAATVARPDAVWFEAADRTQIHVYGPGDDDHEFFTSGPVVGLVVDDFGAAREAMIAAGIEFVGEPQQAGTAVWNHYVGPDGNVYEIMGAVTAGG